MSCSVYTYGHGAWLNSTRRDANDEPLFGGLPMTTQMVRLADGMPFLQHIVMIGSFVGFQGQALGAVGDTKCVSLCV